MEFGWALVLGAVALIVNALSLYNVLGRHIRLRLPQVANPARATLVLPVTGGGSGLGELVAALGIQTLPPRRLIVAVESRHDPAFALARDLASGSAIPIEIAIAGEATAQAQKCRNQQAGLALVDSADEAIVLLDADIRPQDWWLSALVSPLADGTADLVAGLRWQQVSRHRLGAHLTAAIDRAIMLLPRMGGAWSNVVWGGSIGLTPAAAARMDLDKVLATTLSDDLSIASAAEAVDLTVLTRGALFVPSPTTFDIAGAFRFAARQYRIVHVYRPWLWRLALATIGLRTLGWGALLASAVSGALLPALGALAALATLKQVLVGELGRRVGLPDPPAVRLAQAALGPLQMLVDLFHLAAILAAIRTTPLTWGHVVYDVAAPDDVSVRRRLPFPSP